MENACEQAHSGLQSSSKDFAQILSNFLRLFLKFKSNFYSRILLNGRFNTLRVSLIVMLSLRTLVKYNLNGTAYCDSSLQLRLNNFGHKQSCNENSYKQKKQFLQTIRASNNQVVFYKTQVCGMKLSIDTAVLQLGRNSR